MTAQNTSHNRDKVIDKENEMVWIGPKGKLYNDQPEFFPKKEKEKAVSRTFEQVARDYLTRNGYGLQLHDIEKEVDKDHTKQLDTIKHIEGIKSENKTS